MRIDHLAFGITAGLACASCNGMVAALSQGAPALLAGGSHLAASRTAHNSNSLASTTPEKCHPVESVVMYGGEKVPSYGRACEQPDGSWVVTASSDPTNITEAIDGSSTPRPRMSAFAPAAYPYEDDWCTMGRPGFSGMYGPGFGGMYGGGFALRHRHFGRRR
jgi:hypothetical protein